MNKRKREDEGDDNSGHVEDQALRIRISRLQAKLDQGIKSLTASLKLAKGFERQKLGRRLKESANEPHILLRLREEVILLRSLEPEKLAKNYLRKQMIKAKRIRESPAFIHIYGPDPQTDIVKPGAEANLLGRLFSSSPVKQVMPDIIKSIFHTLGLSQVATNQKASTTDRSPKAAPKIAEFQHEDSFEGFSDAITNSDDDRRLDDEPLSDEDMMDSFAERLASSGGESSDVELDDFQHLQRLRPSTNSTTGLDRDSISPSLSSRSSSPDQLGLATRKSQDGDLKPSSVISKTSFLPSLSMGGYYSGSESGEDVPNYDASGPPLRQERKNRRGQVARRRLAELKFGQNAKHLQRQQRASNRDTGWDAKRGAVDAREKSRGRPGQYVSNRYAERGATDNKVVQRSSREKKINGEADSGKIHPSWEAAKQRKSQSIGPAAFAGKKITFD